MRTIIVSIKVAHNFVASLQQQSLYVYYDLQAVTLTNVL